MLLSGMLVIISRRSWGMWLADATNFMTVDAYMKNPPALETTIRTSLGSGQAL
jgi:hypothetical protein